MSRSLRRGRPCALIVATAHALACAPVIQHAMPPRRPRSSVVIDATETAHCQRTSVDPRARQESLAGPVDDPALVEALRDVPADVRRTARAAGLEPLLAELLQKHGGGAALATDDLVAARLQVVMRISSLEIQLASVLFEADCEGDQMEAVLLEIDGRHRNYEIAMTVSSIVLGAAIGIGAGVWQLRRSDSNAPAILGIAGGAGSASLGLAAFARPRVPVVYAHERNLLAPVIAGEDPEHLYPEFVFRMLTSAASPGEKTPRDELVADWRSILDDTIPVKRRELAQDIAFTDGGVYDGALVDAREQMFDALESQLNGMDRDLENLYRFFARLLEDDRTGATSPSAGSSPPG